jgi:hypothetical protein
MEIENEKIHPDFITGWTRGWPATTWAGDSGDPEGYFFKISLLEPGKVKVFLMVQTSGQGIKPLKGNERSDLKSAIKKHYEAVFPDCTLTR